MFGVKYGASAFAKVGFYFLKRLRKASLVPSLDLLLRNPLYDPSLIEQGKAVPLLLARCADQRFNRIFLSHR